MKIRNIITSSLLVAPVLYTAAQSCPNIILILADDMGYSDIGCFGSEIQTPNIDRLAQQGIRYNNFYNCARSCPTRASLLTGLYPHQAGMGNMVIDQGADSYRGDINEHCLTIAQVLQQNGYTTYMTGKWHLTKHTDMFKNQLPDTDQVQYTSKYNWPLQRGFDKFYGTIHGAGSYFEPTTLVDGNNLVNNFEKDFYYTDVISDKTVEFIQDHLSKTPDKSFFCYVSYTAPHWPLHALEEDIKKYKGVYDKGWDKIRFDRYEKLITQGVIDSYYPLSDRPEEVNAWIDEPLKEYYAKCMEVYAAQIDRMDHGIGKIMELLKEKKVDENTMIIFLSDNGGCAEVITDKWPQSLHMPYTTVDGHEIIRGYSDDFENIGSKTSYASYGIGWANASNTPFKYYKHYIHEGGITTPLIISWPQKLKEKGIISKNRGHVIDMMPTCLDAAQIVFPTEHNGNRLTPLEGKSMFAIDRDPLKVYYWEHHGNKGVLKGDWKLVQINKKDWELYNINQDRTEINNLIDHQPTIVEELKSLYSEWANKIGVIDNIKTKKNNLSPELIK